MQSNCAASEPTSGPFLSSAERRKGPRFDMNFPVFLRGMGDPWTLSQTADVSAAGALVVCDRPFPSNTPIEYVLTFPTELTKAPLPLRVRFFGIVVRCEQTQKGTGGFGVAVRNTAHRYLTRDEAVGFDPIEQKLSSPPPSQAAASRHSRAGAQSAHR